MMIQQRDVRSVVSCKKAMGAGRGFGFGGPAASGGGRRASGSRRKDMVFSRYQRRAFGALEGWQSKGRGRAEVEAKQRQR